MPPAEAVAPGVAQAGVRAGAGAVAALALLVTAIVLLPVLAYPFLPLEDLPNHVARRHIAAAPPDGPLAAYFRHAAQLGTNAAVDLAWWGIGRHLTDAQTFSRLAIGWAMAGFVLSILLLHRVLHGRWSAWPLASALLVHNAALLWGFENFVVTLPLAVLGIAAWVGLAGRGLLLRLAVTAALAGVLYLGHVLAFLAYLVFVAGWELGRLWQGLFRQKRAWWGLLALRWPELALLGAVCLGHLGAMAAAEPAAYGAATAFGTTLQRVTVLLAPFGRPGGGVALEPLALQMPVVFCAGAILYRLARRGTAGMTLVLAPGAGVPVGLFCLVTLLMPATLSGVEFTHVRFPALCLGLVLAATDLRLPAPRLRGALFLALLALVAWRSLIFAEGARIQSAEIADLRQVAGALPAGARVLPVRGTGSLGASLHWHSAAHLVPFAQAFVPTLFTQGSHALALRPDWAHLSAAQPLSAPAPLLAAPPAGERRRGLAPAFDYLATWERDFTHVLAIGVEPDEMPAGLPLAPVASRGIFTLHAVLPPAGG